MCDDNDDYALEVGRKFAGDYGKIECEECGQDVPKAEWDGGLCWKCAKKHRDPTPYEYQEFTRTTAIYPDAGDQTNAAIEYAVIEVCSEVGELAGMLKMAILCGYGARSILFRDEAIKHKLGDIAWGLARCCDELGFGLGEVLKANMVKLEDRKRRGVIEGEGDER